MLTLEKIMTELNVGSIKEIVGGRHGNSHKRSRRSNSNSRSRSRSRHNRGRH
jgi:hypothetical protein